MTSNILKYGMKYVYIMSFRLGNGDCSLYIILHRPTYLDL